MTRINAGIHPKLLADQHLIAEYRETPMVHAALRRSLRTKSLGEVLGSIPGQFTLNSGHVKFFYDKLGYLERRYNSLVEEMKIRGFSPDESRTLSDDLPAEFYRDWDPTEVDNAVVAKRIKEKFNMKPDWYRHYGYPAATMLYSKFNQTFGV